VSSSFGYLAGVLGFLAHTCALNSSSRCFWYFSTISVIEWLIGGPVGLNCHAHSEHAQPRKRSFSTHTSSRAIAGFYDGLFDLWTQRHYEDPLPRVLVKDEVLTGRWQRQFSDASLGGFKGCHRVTPKYTTTTDFENV
jgi:hypothetical protein